jgi:hypothetical protein
MSKRILPEPGDGRVETGALQFGEDWPGLFLRGDDCLHLLLWLEHMLENDTDSIDAMQVNYLILLIRNHVRVGATT